MYDNHIHSKFSTDSQMDAIEACQKAIELGLNGIAFTDHVDYDYPDFDIQFLIQMDKYQEYFRKLQIDWQGKLDILLGIEMGFQPHVLEKINSTLSDYSFDFIINSVHVIDRLDPYTGAFFIGKTQKEAYERYLKEILCSIKAYDNFDVIGHIGYVSRYGSFEEKPIKFTDYSDILDQILKTIIDMGKGIEINTSGLRSDLNSPIPGYDIFERYFKLGGEIITIGSDAHNIDHLAGNFSDAAQYLKNIGFKYLTHFKERKPIFEGI